MWLSFQIGQFLFYMRFSFRSFKQDHPGPWRSLYDFFGALHIAGLKDIINTIEKDKQNFSYIE